jgi:tetratricopeptide (TPR) repeat protein
LARTPDDTRFSLQLADVHIASSTALRRTSDWPNARKGYARAVELLEKLDQAHPGDQETQLSLASAYSGAAMCDIRVGRSKEALAAFRKTATIRENFLKQDDKNVAARRELMFVYAHMGDLLGNPNLPNLGDTKGAVQAYGRVLEIARRIHDADPADQRARSDYAIALTRVAIVEEIPSRIRMLRQAIQLQNEVAQTNPDDRSNRSDIAINYKFLGDAYRNTGDRQNAIQAYREGLRLAESMFPAVTPVLATGIVTMYRSLGELMARNGERRAAVEMGEKALQLGDPAGPTAKQWPAVPYKLMSARGTAAMGWIFAALAKSVHRRPSDLEEARRWLQKGLLLYREREALGPMTNDLKREMREVETELETFR